MKNLSLKATFPLLVILLLMHCSYIEAQECRPSGKVEGKKTPPGMCNIKENDCCLEGTSYNAYTCSPPVSRHTKAYLSLTRFENGGDILPYCDGQYHSNRMPIVALSTGWFNHAGRCHRNITVRGNEKSVLALVVDECDSNVGCDEDQDYQPPCTNNVVASSKGIWPALGVPNDKWCTGLNITWSAA